MYSNELLDFVSKKDRRWKDVVSKFSTAIRPTSAASKVLGRAAAYSGKPIFKTVNDIITVSKPAKKDIKHIYKA